MTCAGGRGQLDFHWMQFAIDHDEQIHFESVVGVPKVHIRFSLQRHESLHGFGNDPADVSRMLVVAKELLTAMNLQ
jgi:hypothetical protein